MRGGVICATVKKSDRKEREKGWEHRLTPNEIDQLVSSLLSRLLSGVRNLQRAHALVLVIIIYRLHRSC